jgi:hypothetical protein
MLWLAVSELFCTHIIGGGLILQKFLSRQHFSLQFDA